MTKTITMKNSEIYTTAASILENFKSDLVLPVKVNFYLQKNMKIIIELAQEIETARTEIISKYGKPSEEDPSQFTVEADMIATANQELNDLFEIEQEVKVHILDLDKFENIELTSTQLSAITYMFEDEEE